MINADQVVVADDHKALQVQDAIMVVGCFKMVEPVVATAVIDDDHVLTVLDPDADLVRHSVDLEDIDVDLYLFDVYDVLLCLLLSRGAC